MVIVVDKVAPQSVADKRSCAIRNGIRYHLMLQAIWIHCKRRRGVTGFLDSCTRATGQTSTPSATGPTRPTPLIGRGPSRLEHRPHVGKHHAFRGCNLGTAGPCLAAVARRRSREVIAGACVGLHRVAGLLFTDEFFRTDLGDTLIA